MRDIATGVKSYILFGVDVVSRAEDEVLDRIKTLNQGRSFEPIRGRGMDYKGKDIMRVEGIGRGQNSQNTSLTRAHGMDF
jgi:hypothetical protein